RLQQRGDQGRQSLCRLSRPQRRFQGAQPLLPQEALPQHLGDRVEGRILDTYTKLACAKLYDRMTPLVAAELLNDRVIPFFDEHGIRLQRVLTDRGTEYCGAPERHEYELYLAVENIDHSRTKVKSPQTNGIVERFHRTALNEFYRVAL